MNIEKPILITGARVHSVDEEGEVALFCYTLEEMWRACESVIRRNGPGESERPSPSSLPWETMSHYECPYCGGRFRDEHECSLKPENIEERISVLETRLSELTARFINLRNSVESYASGGSGAQLAQELRSQSE